MTNQNKTAELSGVGLNDELERLDVGKYIITRYYEDYWIENESGEGMQVFKHNFEKLIDDYYKSEF